MKIKLFVGVSILCFFVIATSVVAGYTIVQKRNEGGNIKNSSKFGQLVTAVEVKDGSLSQQDGTVTTAVDASTHNTPDDCWIIISDKIYDVTKFLSTHPGGSLVITPYCGKDATGGFNTKDKKPPSKHTTLALQILAQYFVANVGDKITSTNGNPSGSLANPVTNKNLPTIKPGTTANPNIILPTTAPLLSSTTTLTTSAVATHNTVSNCWLIISNNVYNVSSYLVQHPGGVSVIQAYCGKEATQAFQTRGGKGSNHSNYAYSLLSSYLVGTIGSVVPAPTTAPTTTTPAPTSSGSSLPASVSAKYPGATLKSIEDDRHEMEIIYNGSCRHIKVNTGGAIISDSAC